MTRQRPTRLPSTRQSLCCMHSVGLKAAASCLGLCSGRAAMLLTGRVCHTHGCRLRDVTNSSIAMLCRTKPIIETSTNVGACACALTEEWACTWACASVCAPQSALILLCSNPPNALPCQHSQGKSLPCLALCLPRLGAPWYVHVWCHDLWQAKIRGCRSAAPAEAGVCAGSDLRWILLDLSAWRSC